MIKLFKTPQKSVNINASKLFIRTPNGSVGKPRIFKKQVTHSNLNRISHLHKIYDNAGKELRNSSRKLTHIQLNFVRPKDKKKALEEANKSKNNAINNDLDIFSFLSFNYLSISRRDKFSLDLYFPST